MKKLFLFLAMASTTMFVSCSSDDSDNTPPVEPPIEATKITLSATLNAIELGQTVTLTVTDDLTNNVTSTSTFVITPATGATVTAAGVFTATEAGVYTVVAKYEELTSLPQVIEVTVPVPPFEGEGSVMVGGETFTTDFSALWYLGTTEAGMNVFMANPYSVDDTTDPVSYPNDVYVFITVAQVGTEFLTFPTTGAYAFGDIASAMKAIDANILIDGEEILATGVTTNASLNLSSFVNTDEEATWDFTYEVTMEDNSVVTGEYTGDWGFVNASQQARPAAKSNAKTTSVTKVSKAQLKANLKSVLAKKIK